VVEILGTVLDIKLKS